MSKSWNSELLCAVAAGALCGCSMLTGNTQKAEDTYSSVSAQMQRAADGIVARADFKTIGTLEADMRSALDRGATAAELSGKEKDVVLERSQEELRRLIKELIAPAWAKQELARLTSEADKFMEAGEFAKAANALKSRKPVGQEDVDALVAEGCAKHLDGNVYPAWIKAVCDKTEKAVLESVKAGKFLEAREIAWNAPLTGEKIVDAELRKHCVQLLRERVNPAQLPVLEKELDELAAKHSASEDGYEQGIAALKGYRLQRAYSEKLDRQLAAVVKEALKLGVDESKTLRAHEVTAKLLLAAANLADEYDNVTKTTTSKVVSEAFSPKMKAYEDALASYRKELVKFDCTEASANAAVSAADGVLRPLIAALGREAKLAKSTTSSLSLGITALNNRVDAHRKELIAGLEKKIEAREQAKLDAKIKWLEEEVGRLVKAGKYDEARELAWMEAASDARLRCAAVRLVARTVNPAQWAQVEPEVNAKVAALSAEGRYDEAIDWLKAYPRIRVYALEIDEKLSSVGEAAVKMGLGESKVAAVVAETGALAQTVERLMNDTDRTVRSEPAKTLDFTGLDAALDAYKAALARHDCTGENAEALAKSVKDRLVALFAESGPDEGKAELELGCNAFNKRLDRLLGAHAEALVDAKCAAVSGDLVERVFAAVNAGKFGEARIMIRDEQVSGSPDLDAKLYALRIGLLNSVVNPADVKHRMSVIDENERNAAKNGTYAELVRWIESYEYITCDFPSIAKSLASIREAGAGFRLDDDEMAAYSAELADRLATILAKRTGSYSPAIDGKPLDEALAGFEKAFSGQYFDDMIIGVLSTKIRNEIAERYKVRFAPLTTYEANAKLRARLAQATDNAVADAEFCDFQVAKTESAIAKGTPGLNAVLGDYARAMRLRKRGLALDGDMLQSVLLGAIYLNEPVVFDRALASGATADGSSARDDLKRPPVLLAIEAGKASYIARLRSANASMASVDANGDGVVHYAVKSGDLAVIKEMMACGDVNKANNSGETPLFAAARSNQAAAVKMLTGAKADVSVKNREGLTAFAAACAAGSSAVLDALVEAGAAFGVDDLVLAVRNRRLCVVRWLVSAGVDVNGKGVMEAARRCSEVKRYLVSQGGTPLPCDGPCCNPPAEVSAKTGAEEAK